MEKEHNPPCNITKKLFLPYENVIFLHLDTALCNIQHFLLYFLGQGVELNYDAAKERFTQAVQAGDLEATRYLRIVKQFQY